MSRSNAEILTMDDWHEVGRLEDIPLLGSRVIHSPEGNVAVFRAGDDTIFALEDRCPHKGGPLSQGIVFGHTVACPLHNWCIEMASGCAVAPDEGNTRSYPIKVIDGIIYLDLRRA